MNKYNSKNQYKLVRIVAFVAICLLSNTVFSQYAKNLIKQQKFDLKYLPSFSSLDGNYIYVHDNLTTDSVKMANTSFFAIERINITLYSEDSLKKMKLNPNDLTPIGLLQTVQNVDELRNIYSKTYIQSFIDSKQLKTEKDVVDYFKSKRTFNDYGIWYNLIETRRALGLVFLDKQVKVGNKYLYFISRINKNGSIESVGTSIAVASNSGNFLLSKYHPRVAQTMAQDSSLLVSWKLPINVKQIKSFIEQKSKEKNFIPMPFGEFNVRGAVYLQTNIGWEKTDILLPSINTTKDTLSFNYVAKATPEKTYNIFLQIEDEVHNKGNESDTARIFVVNKDHLPVITNVSVKDTINAVRLSWNALPNKPYIESIEISKSELNTVPIKMYVRPTDTCYTDYQVQVGKTYVYKLKTIFLPQTNLKQIVPAEGVGKFSVFTKPLAPTNLKAKNLGNHIQLSWENDSIPGFYGFFIYRGTALNTLERIDGPIFKNEYIDTASYLSGKSVYYYAVESQNLRQQVSGYSNRVSIMPKRSYEIYKPAQIDYFYANNTLSLKWDDVSLQDSYIKSYLIQRKSENQKDFSNLAIIDIQHHDYNDTTVERGITFEYRIACITIKGDTSAFTEPLVFNAKKREVAILLNFNIRSITDGIEIELPSLVFENRKSYNIYRREDGISEFSKIGNLGAEDFIFMDKNVKMGKYYHYAISIIENDGREGKLCDAKAVKRD